MRFYTKVYKAQDEVVVAVCDEELRGKCFEEGDIVLHVKKEFYGEELKGEKETAELLKSATIANIVGENAVALAARIGLIDVNAVLKVKGVPHVQMVQM